MNSVLKMSCFVAVIAILACSKSEKNEPSDGKSEFISLYKDEPYIGKADAKMYVGGYDPLPSIDGNGTFSLDKIKDDSVMIIIDANFEGGDSYNFAMPGKQKGKEWAFNGNLGSFTINDKGSMTGEVADGKKRIQWKGNLFDDRLMLDVTIKYLISEGNIPEESILRSSLDLKRRGHGTGGMGGGCEKLAWVNKTVFNWGSGTMDLALLPVCQ